MRNAHELDEGRTMFEIFWSLTDSNHKHVIRRKERTMKIRNTLLTAFAILGLAMLFSPAIQAQTCTGGGSNFIDLNGDGFNDNAPDQDGDGIPNGLDADYVKNAQDGSGYKNGKLAKSQGEGAVQAKTMTKAQMFNRLQAFNGNMFQNRIKTLSGMNGSGTGICDGSGGGTSGTGICDGTGPHGKKLGGK